VGDHLYIIIKGGVNVIKTKINMQGEKENHIITSLYDGKSFGDLALMD
jgi:hypothetical protein